MKINNLIVAPMRYRGEVLGAIAVANCGRSHTFSTRDLDLLQALADQASIAVHFGGLGETLQQKQVLDYDLDVARQIQRSLLPGEIPTIPGIELAAFNHPARRIGGDYYDFIQLDEHHLGIAIADVSGKGVPGALMMSICRSVLRAQARGVYSPAQVLRALNRVLGLDITEDMFVSMLYMIPNTQTRELIVARAGHEKPIHWKAATQEMTFLESSGVAIGIAFPEVLEASLDELRVQLEPGDVIVAYTDGVTEAMDSEQREWGVDSLLDSIQAGAQEGAVRILHNVTERIGRFVGDQPQYDDTTLIAMRVVD